MGRKEYFHVLTKCRKMKHKPSVPLAPRLYFPSAPQTNYQKHSSSKKTNKKIK